MYCFHVILSINVYKVLFFSFETLMFSFGPDFLWCVLSFPQDIEKGNYTEFSYCFFCCCDFLPVFVDPYWVFYCYLKFWY